jgi:hypothetical protein
VAGSLRLLQNSAHVGILQFGFDLRTHAMSQLVVPFFILLLLCFYTHTLPKGQKNTVEKRKNLVQTPYERVHKASKLDRNFEKRCCFHGFWIDLEDETEKVHCRKEGFLIFLEALNYSTLIILDVRCMSSDSKINNFV